MKKLMPFLWIILLIPVAIATTTIDDNSLVSTNTFNISTTNGLFITSSNLNMTSQNITDVDAMRFDTAGCTEESQEGTLCWNFDQKTLNVVRGNGQIYQVGKEISDDGINEDTVNIEEGSLVCMTGFQGDNPKFKRAVANNLTRSAFCGILTIDCNVGDLCPVTTFGFVNNVNTDGLTTGAFLYSDPSTPGQLTTTQPLAWNDQHVYGVVGRISATVGTIFATKFINPTNGFTINNIYATGNVTADYFHGKIDWSDIQNAPSLSNTDYWNVSGINTTELLSNASNGQTAYNWGNHAIQGYITDGNTNWDNSYGFITNNNASINATQVKMNTDFELMDWYNSIQSAGRISGGLITDNGNGSVTVALGTGLIKNESGTPADGEVCEYSNCASIGQTKYILWNTQPEVNITDNAYNYLYYEGASGTIKSTTNFYSIDYTRDFTVGRVYRMGNEITIRLCGTNIWNFNRRVQLFGEEVFPVIRARGMELSETGTRNIGITAGILWAELVNRFTTDAFDSSIAGNNFTTWYRNSTGGWTRTLEQTQVDNTYWDDGTGTLNDLTANRYGVHWVYVVHDNSVHVVYGQGDYILTNAETATPPSTLPGLVSSYGTLIGKIIIQKSATNFTEVQSAFTQVFTTTSVQNHNDLSGLQGGTASEYYHLNSANYTYLTSGLGSFLKQGIMSTNGYCKYNGVADIIDCNNTITVSETDPIYSAVAAELIGNASNGQTAYDWGDHAQAGYLTAETDPQINILEIGKFCYSDGNVINCNMTSTASETDPIFTTSDAFLVNSTAIGNWNQAYIWGDHTVEGYIIDGNTNWDNLYGFITATNHSHSDYWNVSGINTTELLSNASNGQTAYNWGNHAIQGYITDGNTNWDNSYGFVTATNHTHSQYAYNVSVENLISTVSGIVSYNDSTVVNNLQISIAEATTNLTTKINGSGTIGTISKFTETGEIGDSLITEDGSGVYVDGGYTGGGISLLGSGDGLFFGDLLIGGDILSVSTTSINGTYTPSADNTYDLGTASLQWQDVYSAEFIGAMNWTYLQNYPGACDAGKAVTTIGDTLTCTTFVTSETDPIYSLVAAELIGNASNGQTAYTWGDWHSTTSELTTNVTALQGENTTIWAELNNHNSSIEARSPIASPTFTGTVTLTLTDVTSTLNLTVEPSSDHTATGQVIKVTTGEELAIGDLVFLNSSATWWKADADFYNMTQGMMGIATTACNSGATCLILIDGFYRDDTWTWTAGQSLYASTTPGNPTSTAPSSTGDFVRIPCHAYSDDVIFCKFDNTVIEI